MHTHLLLFTSAVSSHELMNNTVTEIRLVITRQRNFATALGQTQIDTDYNRHNEISQLLLRDVNETRAIETETATIKNWSRDRDRSRDFNVPSQTNCRVDYKTKVKISK